MRLAFSARQASSVEPNEFSNPEKVVAGKAHVTVEVIVALECLAHCVPLIVYCHVT